MSGDAANWAIRRDAGALTPDEQARFDAWIAADERRLGALLRAEAALALVDRAQAVSLAEPAAGSIGRRGMLRWGAAATALAAGAAGFWLLPGGETLSTRIGEIRRTRLADASVVTLNTQSRVTIDLTPDERRIALTRGEAWFQVAHDRRRPFVVSAADLKIRAVGTAFSVRRMTDGVEVLVTEGKVEVWRADQPGTRAAIPRGRRAFVADDAIAIVPVRADAGIERALAWRAGGLALAGESLDYAVGEINRYNRTQVRVDDPVLGRAAIVGYFRVDDPAGFARSIATLENARVEADGAILRIVPRSS